MVRDYFGELVSARMAHVPRTLADYLARQTSVKRPAPTRRILRDLDELPFYRELFEKESFNRFWFKTNVNRIRRALRRTERQFILFNWDVVLQTIPCEGKEFVYFIDAEVIVEHRKSILKRDAF